jgi:hypothetical protein
MLIVVGSDEVYLWLLSAISTCHMISSCISLVDRLLIAAIVVLFALIYGADMHPHSSFSDGFCGYHCPQGSQPSTELPLYLVFV